MISATTQLCGIVLHPAGHTRSPAMHNAAFAALGLDAVYVAFDVKPEELADAVRGARALGIRQLAVSIPHKEAVMAHVDEVEETARRIGAVNTVTRIDGRLIGANTDWVGVVRALERETRLEDVRAVVLGAGGTARAALYGLREAGARISVLNRTPARAEALAAEFGAETAGGLEVLEELAYEVLVNTTSVGLRQDRSPVPVAALRPGAVVLDAVYDPPRTRLLREAAERGARPIEGRWMLIEQAVEQIRIWTGRAVDPGVLLRALDAAP